MIINKMVKPSELQLKDIVKLFGVSGYDTATVVEIDADRVHLVRPYIHVASLTVVNDDTSKVIDYIGTERFCLLKCLESHSVLLVER